MPAIARIWGRTILSKYQSSVGEGNERVDLMFSSLVLDPESDYLEAFQTVEKYDRSSGKIYYNQAKTYVYQKYRNSTLCKQLYPYLFDSNPTVTNNVEENQESSTETVENTNVQ